MERSKCKGPEIRIRRLWLKWRVVGGEVRGHRTRGGGAFSATFRTWALHVMRVIGDLAEE